LETTNTASAVCTVTNPQTTSTTCILNGVQGIVTSNNGTTFTMVVTGITANQATSATGSVGPPEVAGLQSGSGALTIGTKLVVTPDASPAAAYGVLANTGTLTSATTPALNGCAVFTGLTSIGPGQTVIIDIPITTQSATVAGISTATVTTATNSGTATADAIILVPSESSGALPGSGVTSPTTGSPTLTLTPSNAVYTNAAITSLQVQTSPAVVNFQGNLSGTVVTGTPNTLTITGLSNSGVIRFSGLQYNSCTPALIAPNTLGTP
jgi:hypothetical protein